MKNFSNQFRKTVNDMKPDKSEIRHSVLNGGTNRKPFMCIRGSDKSSAHCLRQACRSCLCSE